MMHKYVISIMVVMLISATSVSMAQQMEVSGVVTDADTGLTLPGVNVVIQGTSQGTTTDLDGLYSIIVPSPEAALVFSYIGYETIEIPINGQSEIDVALLTVAIVGEELVVVGYGTQKKVNLTGAVSSISSAEIENRPIASVEEALQGQVPGLQVVRTGGQPGNQSIDINIRGTSTFSNNPVLILVDGVESSLDQINPNDIESVSVLKDAASTAIYGSRASGGVILVKTKEGQIGAPQVNVRSIVSRQSVTRFPERVSALDHALLYNEAQRNDGVTPSYSEADIELYSSPDWKDADRAGVFLQDALQTNQNISISGGTASHDYYLSLGYLNQEGVVRRTEFERLNLQLTQNFHLTDRLSVNLIAGYIPSTMTAPTGGNIRLDFGIFSSPETNTIRSEDGNKYFDTTASRHFQGGKRELNNNRLSGNFTLDYEVLPNLIITGRYGIINNVSKREDFQKKFTVYSRDNPDLISREQNINQSEVVNSSNILQSANLISTSTHTFGNHDFSILAGLTAEWFERESELIRVRDFLSEDIQNINAGSRDPSEWNISGSASEWSMASVISRVTYSYDDRYLLEGNLRYDGSSRFGESQRWGYFPAISAGWIVTGEDFFPDNDFLTFLKLRGSWGQVGNQNVAGFYPTINTLSQSIYHFGGSPQRTIAIPGGANPLLTWETKETRNIGIEGSIFGRLLDFEVDLFEEVTRDILLLLPVPTTFGLATPQQNVGRVDNRGWELQLHHRNNVGGLSYGVSFNVSDATNEIVDLGGQGPQIIGNVILEEGSPMNMWFGLENPGGNMQEKDGNSFFQSEAQVENHATQKPGTSPGDLIYIDQNSDGVIDSNDRVQLGRSDPRYHFGVRINLNYRNFDFTAFGQGVMSHLVWSNSFTASNFDRGGATVLEHHKDRWTPDNTNAQFPQMRIGSGASDDGINDQFSSFWLEDASYFRMKHIEVGYALPNDVLNRFNMRGARIFVSSENLFTITNYLGFDPEIPTGVGARLVESRYPLPKTFNFGINLNF